MEERSCFWDFVHCTLLSVLGTLGVSCYILADTFFVSKGLGTGGLAALNLAIPIYNFIHGTGLMLGMGGATRFSICASRGGGEADRIYMNAVYLAAAFSALFVLTGLLFSTRLSLLLGADETVLEMTDTYLRWLLLFSPAFIFNDILLCFVRNDEGPQLSMAAMLTGSFANIVLDYIFIFPMELGIFGAVFATGLSPVISMIMMLPHRIRRKNTFHLVKTKPEGRLAARELSLGFPSLLAQLSSGIVMITFNAVILTLEGNTGVAAYGVVANISLVVVSIYTGIAQGVQPLLSRAYGRRDPATVHTVLRYAMQATVLFSLLLYLLLFFFAQPVTRVFNSENDLNLQQIAETGLRLYFTSSVFVGFNILQATYFTSTDHARPAHILSLLRGLILIIPMTFLFAALGGMTGVWLTYPAAELLTALAGAAVYQRKRKKIEN